MTGLLVIAVVAEDFEATSIVRAEHGLDEVRHRVLAEIGRQVPDADHDGSRHGAKRVIGIGSALGKRRPHST